MKTLKELMADKAQLEMALANARKQESRDGLLKVQKLIAEFGFTAQQVFPWRPEVKNKAVAKYLDAKSGATWTGRGKPPAWIKGKNRNDFLIERPQELDRGPYLVEMAMAAAAKSSR